MAADRLRRPTPLHERDELRGAARLGKRRHGPEVERARRGGNRPQGARDE